jgi:cytochrome c oxidase assembly factor 5
MIDMRKRFRGNRPVGISAELEGAGSGDATVGTIEEKGYMLYAGKPTQRVRVTSGDEGPNVVPEGYVEVRQKDGKIEVMRESGQIRKG